jgi:hypothetical protein
MEMMLKTDDVWEVQIAGEEFLIYAYQIPKETWIAIVKDRLTQKGKDTWADSSKVTIERTRQVLWSEAMETVYTGSWVPGSGRGSGPRRKSMDWDTFFQNATIKEAKRRIGKKGFRGADGHFYRPNHDESLERLVGKLKTIDKWKDINEAEFNKLKNESELEI